MPVPVAVFETFILSESEKASEKVCSCSGGGGMIDNKQDKILIDIESLPEVEMIASRLHARTCEDIINRSSVLTDPILEEGEDSIAPIFYSHSLLNTSRDDDPRNICLPPFVKKLIQREKDLYGYRWMSEPFRRHTLHGLARHDITYGNRLHDLLDHDIIGNAIDSNDRKILYAIGDGVKCDFLSKRCTTVRFNEEFWDKIEQSRDDAGVDDREKWLVYLVVLSLQDHPRFAGWKDEFDKIISLIQQQLDTRIEKLEKIIRG